MKIIHLNTVARSGSISAIMRSIGDGVVKDDGASVIAYGRGDAPAGSKAVSLQRSRTYDSKGSGALNRKTQTAVDFGSGIGFFCHVMRNFFKGEMGFGSAKQTKKLISFIEDYHPDIIHLHNLHGFYLQVEILFRYLKQCGIPVIWTLHDCWAFTGQCAYFTAAKCERWKTGCFDCPIYRTNYPYSLFKDNSKENYLCKKDAFCGVKNLTIVTPSKWLAECVKESFLKGYKVHVIPNGVDRDVFHAYDENEKTDADDRSVWKKVSQAVNNTTPSDGHNKKKIVLGVANVWTKNKGMPAFEMLANELPPDYRIVLIGLSKPQIRRLAKQFAPDRLLPLPKTADAKELAAWYNMVDVFVNPTLEDNFPTTNLEALSCGCPIVTYNVGGSAECLTDGAGYAVMVNDTAELIRSVQEAVHCNRKICGQHAEEEFGSQVMCEKYIALYKDVCA